MDLKKKLFVVLFIIFIALNLITISTVSAKNLILKYKITNDKRIIITKHAELHIDKNYIDKEHSYLNFLLWGYHLYLDAIL